MQMRIMPLHAIRLPLLLIFLCGNSVNVKAQDARRFLESPVNPRSGLSCPSAAQYSPSRPDPAGTPTVVGLTVMFQDIARLNDVDQTLTTDVYIFARWRDPRLADPARGDASADCPLPGNNFWMPDIEPENLRNRNAFYDPHFFVDANGTVTLARRLLVEISCPLDLHDFPFDRHLFRITLWPTISRTEEVTFYPLNKWLVINENLSILGWDVGSPRATVYESSRMGRLGTYSRYDVVIELARDWGFYALKLGVPLLLIVLMAYGVYYIPPTAIPQQVALSMTSMLTLIAYMLTLGNSLPKISYLTRADRLFVLCAVIVFLGLLKAVLTMVWAQRDAKNLIRRVDRLGRILYPVAVLLVVIGVVVF
jgi:hypothetical protein